MVFLPIKLV